MFDKIRATLASPFRDEMGLKVNIQGGSGVIGLFRDEVSVWRLNLVLN